MNEMTIKSIVTGACVSFASLGLAAWPAAAAGLLSPTDGGKVLQIRDHAVRVVVEDGYAITTVEQTFANPHTRDLEAIYSFPVPKKGAVSEFTYWIDGAPVTAEVLEKETARQIYDDEKAAGRETGLAEQDSYRTFDISVWPVHAQDHVRVRLAYIQPVSLETGIGRFAYPLEEGGVDEEKLAFWVANEEVSETFSFDLHLKTDYVVEALRLPAHPTATISQSQDGTWRVHIDNAAVPDAANAIDPEASEAKSVRQRPVRLDTDIVVYWRQMADEPARVDTVVHKPDSAARGTFMLTLTPGMDLQPISEGRDWVFVLDQSGSMSGKLATLAEGVARALRKLPGGDRFRIICFSEDAYEVTNGYTPATSDNVSATIDELRNVSADGGTNLFAGLERGLAALDADRTGSIVLVTDGVANIGKTQTRDFFDLMQRNDVRLFTAIMGNSANVPLLEPLTLASNGFAMIVSNADDIPGVLLQAATKVNYEALHGLSLDIVGTEANLRIDDIRRDAIRTLYRGEQLVLFGHYWGQGDAALSLSGQISGKDVSYSTKFAFPDVANRNPEIERLWGFAEIERGLHEMALMGDDADIKTSIVDTSKEYGILSPYTAMLVVRDERFQELALKRNNRDRLAIESAAQALRQGQSAAPVRVDAAQPLFTQPRPTYGGGATGSGALGWPGLVWCLFTGFAVFWMRRSRATP